MGIIGMAKGPARKNDSAVPDRSARVSNIWIGLLHPYIRYFNLILNHFRYSRLRILMNGCKHDNY